MKALDTKLVLWAVLAQFALLLAIVTGEGEMSCGMVWFIHIPKTGGYAVEQMLHREFHEKKQSWTFVDLQSPLEEMKQPDWPLHSPNMSDWVREPKWIQALDELSKEKPRLIIHQHVATAGFATHILPQLVAMNETLKQKGCRVAAVTVLRDPANLIESHMHYWNEKRVFAPHAITPENTNITKFIRHFADETTNFQMQFLVNGGGHAGFKLDPMSPEMILQIRQALDRVEELGREEDLNDFVSRLEALLGVKLGLRHENDTHERLFDVPEEELKYICSRQFGDEMIFKTYFPGVETTCSKFSVTN